MVSYLDTEDVIVARCTPGGASAVNIIRISGPELGSLYKILTKSKKNPTPNTILYKNIYINSVKLDSVLVSYFKGPNSFTGEDVVEINCHGGDIISKNIISKMIEAEYARHALPGEFSFRAYSSGKIDVLQAESINELVGSQTNVFTNKTMENLDGVLYTKIKDIKKRIVLLSTEAEYDLDIDEEELDADSYKNMKKKINEIIEEIDGISSCSLYSNIIKDGVRVAVVGKPNVGKSTMFNYLLGFNRSIVSNMAGTTRDTVEAILEISGYRVILIDTAGCWKSNEEIEKVGIQKTKEEIVRADIVLFLGENKTDLKLIKELNIKKDLITILSKCDINKSKEYNISISSNNGVGFKELLTALSTKIEANVSKDIVGSKYYINKRQQIVLDELLHKMNFIITQIDGLVEKDIIATLIKDLVDTLNEIINPINKEEIINNIFSSFCVGK